MKTTRTEPSQFGISLSPVAFDDMVFLKCWPRYLSLGTADELLLRPRVAMRFCDDVRDALVGCGESEAFDLPDDVILRRLKLNSRLGSR
jgi:hypothetical protein